MTAQLDFQEKYDAICRKDSEYIGVFITCVKTTGIFCHPTCTARKPKPENVEFVTTPKEAILNGYRACKICKPLENPNETPEYIQLIIKELEENPALRLKDWNLRERDIDPATIRRWFKKNHNMTFHGYQRMMRLNRAYKNLTEGGSVTDAAFSSGYESLSGFTEQFQNIFDAAPSDSKSKNVIHITRFTTPLGPMFACATDQGVCLCEFTDRRMLETEFKDLKKRLNAVILPSGENPHLIQLEKEMGEYFEGNRKSFEVALHTPTTDFRQQVWDELIQIPYGKTRSYAEQAVQIGNPKAVRAVATANGQNRVAIVIPCHRVLGSDGSLTGYAGGLGRKQRLLDLEKENL